MTLTERIHILEYTFDEIMSTSSLVEKRAYIWELPEELKEDFEYCVECLNGLHKFGYKYYPCDLNGDRCRDDACTVKDVLELLQQPMLQHNLTQSNIARYLSMTYPWADFFEPIVNRELKLGIGKSILPADGLSAMLAKKYEGSVKYSKDGYYITEKLDGNRCIAHYDGTGWVFTSRNGKEMRVNFDMSGLPKEYVYDGEILAPQQVAMSSDIYNYIVSGEGMSRKYDNVFNSTSGLINRHTLNKNLVYNIFDIMPSGSMEYKYRREVLDKLKLKNAEVRILPILAKYNTAEELNLNVGTILDKVVSSGGEGIMINLGSGNYLHKRTDQLLKYKQVQTMDMRVMGVIWGTGKYQGMIGALECVAQLSDGSVVECNVGSGLSDEQRLNWALNPSGIRGKIVEVAYFSMSQSKDKIGEKLYSLRFPRLKHVRTDKVTTSEF